MLVLEIDNVSGKFTGNLDKYVVEKIKVNTSYFHQGAMFMAKFSSKFKGWNGRIDLFRNNKFPIGLLDVVIPILNKSKVEYRIIDKRAVIKYGKPLLLDASSGFEARPYQKEAIDICKKKGSGIVKIATGGGKTFVISSIVGNYNIKTVIYVIGVELLHQMKSTLERMYPELDVGIIGDGICNIKQINIATIWSAAAAYNKKIEVYDSDVSMDRKVKDLDKEKIRDMVEGAELFILDECQYAAASTVQFLHKNSKSARHRFLFSASPWRDTGDDILIEAVGGKKIFDLPASDLIADGWLVRPQIHFLEVPTLRGVGKKYQEVYKNYIVENEIRNDLILKATKKLVAAGKKVLILVVRVNHGSVLMEKLKEHLTVAFLDGQKSSKQRLSTIQMMKRGELDVLIASKIFDQGVDIPELDALVLAGSGKSSGRALQRIGRVIRKFPGKEKAIVVEFFDNCKFLRNHSEARINIYKTEPLFKIIRQRKKM